MPFPVVFRPVLLLPLLLAACQTGVSPSAPGTPNTPPAPLRNTRWVLQQLGTERITLPENSRELDLLLASDQPQARGNAGCNRFSGSFEQPTPEQLRFGPLLTTKMACPALELEGRYLTALKAAAYYRISGDTLRLYPGPPTDTAPLARLVAVYTQ
ncbi:META domain-containing protein [Hymenobacter gummosus]|uniref:META domain-containing protein n=1 Tax=Hymenobacter gummosus TaxID=1776032 RepID=A0A431U654_9BACT|nr:META domain-containing protein [Hymenobacter gummosus]RTQ52169.1 META domain-containing protein [Hymenobacter gummosus]